MEQGSWTSERLDDLSARVDAGFVRVDADIREVRQEIGATRAELNTRIDDLRLTMLQVGGITFGTMVVGFLGVIATVVAST